MKKFLCYILVFVLVFCSIPLNISAAKSDDGEITLESPIVHEQRGNENIVIKKYYKYSIFFRYKAYFEIQLTDKDNNTSKYKSKSFTVAMWNKDDITIEKACDYDENIKKLYPYIQKVAINKMSEKIVEKALSPSKLVDMLLREPLEAWYKSEKGNICSDVVMSSITPALGFDEFLQNCVEKGLDLHDANQDVITEEGPEEITGATEEEKEHQKTINFAKAIMRWLAMICERVPAIVASLFEYNGGLDEAILNAANPVTENQTYIEIKSKMDIEEIEYHDQVYAFLKSVKK